MPLSFGNAKHSDIGWVVQMRWGVAAAYALSLALAATGVVQHMPMAPGVIATLLTVVSNVIAMGRVDPQTAGSRAIGLLMFDAILLAVVLYFTGGASNPLSVLFLVQIALTALMFRAVWAWSLTALSIAAFGLLFFAPALGDDHSAHAHHMHHGTTAVSSIFNLHLRGMWLGFALSAVLVTYFVTSVSTSLRMRERQLADARDRALRAERVASLAGLAAGTAHELGTPLSTILLAASEIDRGLDQGASHDRLRSDAGLIRDQAKRCRSILDAMIADSGDTLGQAPERSSARVIAQDAIDALPAPDKTRVILHVEHAPDVHLPRRIVAQAIGNLLRNAFDASPTDATVTLRVEAGEAGRVRFSVIDQGRGMDTDLLTRAQEPFVTTKEGKGLGMGLFIVTVVAERLGGECKLVSSPGKGTTALFEVAIDPVRA